MTDEEAVRQAARSGSPVSYTSPDGRALIANPDGSITAAPTPTPTPTPESGGGAIDTKKLEGETDALKRQLDAAEEKAKKDKASKAILAAIGGTSEGGGAAAKGAEAAMREEEMVTVQMPATKFSDGAKKRMTRTQAEAYVAKYGGKIL